jgi:hypothetical protein
MVIQYETFLKNIKMFLIVDILLVGVTLVNVLLSNS